MTVTFGDHRMTDFGDYDPDDAWDASDPVLEQLRNISRPSRMDRRSPATVIIAARIQRIVDDINTVRQRITNGDPLDGRPLPHRPRRRPFEGKPAST